MKQFYRRWKSRWKKFARGEVQTYRYQVFYQGFVGAYNCLVLVLFYYGVLTPISFLLRLGGAHFLRLRHKKGSYWKLKEKNLNYGGPY